MPDLLVLLCVHSQVGVLVEPNTVNLVITRILELCSDLIYNLLCLIQLYKAKH